MIRIMWATLKPILFLFALLPLAACSPLGERTTYSVAYYSIDGANVEEIEHQIHLHGPEVEGVGKALASADISMIPQITLKPSAGECHVQSAKIRVNARVTLPRHTHEKRLKRQLAKTWNNLSEYAKIHEAVHLKIADRNAVEMERAIKAMPAKATCKEMRQAVNDKFDVMYRVHHAEQLEFDRQESSRIKFLTNNAI